MKLFGRKDSNNKSKADSYIIKGNWSKALNEYKKIVAADPDNTQNRKKLGDIYLKLNKKNEAVEEYIQVAENYANDGFLIKAIAVNKLIMKLDPDNIEIQDKLASLYSSRGMDYMQQRKTTPEEEERLSKALPKIPLFSDLSHDEFCKVINKLREKHFKAGEIICNEGDRGDNLFIINEGEVSITRRNALGQDVPLANLSDGSFFGEFAFFSKTDRFATVVASKETLLFEITNKDIEELMKEFPRINDVLFNFYKERVILNLLAMSPVFGPCTSAERKEIMDKFEKKDYKEGEDVIREGDAGDSIFLIKSGNVKVTINKGGKIIELAKLYAGDFFGEIALVTGKPRTATVTSAVKSELLELKKKDFDVYLERHPDINDILQAYLEDRANKTANAVLDFEKESWAKSKMV